MRSANVAAAALVAWLATQEGCTATKAQARAALGLGRLELRRAIFIATAEGFLTISLGDDLTIPEAWRKMLADNGEGEEAASGRRDPELMVGRRDADLLGEDQAPSGAAPDSPPASSPNPAGEGSASDLALAQGELVGRALFGDAVADEVFVELGDGTPGPIEQALEKIRGLPEAGSQ